MKIGVAAELSHMEPSAIRFYEAASVLPAPARTQSGYREYDQSDVDLLRFVRRLRALQLPLDDIRGIVGLRTSGQSPCLPVREAIDREAAAIDARIDELRETRAELEMLRSDVDTLNDDPLVLDEHAEHLFAPEGREPPSPDWRNGRRFKHSSVHGLTKRWRWARPLSSVRQKPSSNGPA